MKAKNLLTPAYEAIAQTVVARHPKADIATIRSAVFRLQTACPDPKDLEGAHLLDVGCGSEKSKDHPGMLEWALSGFRRYDHCKPWFLRAAAAGGAQGFGIDIAPNQGEPFTAIQADLRDPAVFQRKEFRDGMFRVINNNMFTVPRGTKYRDFSFSPHLRGQVGGDVDALYAVNDSIQAQVQRLLAEGGVYLATDQVYEKRDGVLQLTDR